MILSDFKFDEQHERLEVFHEGKMDKKIQFAMDYLLQHLPINKIKKDNTVNFDKLKFDEGKNYDWYFLTKKDLAILVRQYGSHFTFYISRKGKFESKLAVITLHDDKELMTKEEREAFEYDFDSFMGIKQYFPKLVELIEEGKIQSLWNNLTFPRPSYTKVETAFASKDSINSLDTLFFAMDEICSKYLSTYAEKDVLNLIKDYKVGDMFGKAYKITKVATEVQDGYYHGVGLEFQNTNFPDSKPSWSDVYSLARFYSDELNYKALVRQRSILEFAEDNHEEILSAIPSPEQQPFIWMNLKYLYMNELDRLYKARVGEIEGWESNEALTKEFINFIEYSYKMKHK